MSRPAAPSTVVPRSLLPLPPHQLRARGWLHEQLELAARGLTGRMMELWPDVGESSGWLGGDGENWERGPYYARGLVALAHALQDPALQERAQRWIEWTLASQTPDGFFGPRDNDDWWPRMPMLEALRWHAEATGDARVEPFLERYFRHQLQALPARPIFGWGRPRVGDNIESVLWLHDRTGDPRLLELVDLLGTQTSDWLGELGSGREPSDAFEFAHGVNRAMGLKFPALWYRRTGDPAHLAALRRGWETTLAHHGQIQGTYSSDESLHGRGFTQGTELCTIVELLASFESALTISAEPWLGDAIERIACNALPAILDERQHGHQYFQMMNQIACVPGPHDFGVHHDTDLLFGIAPGYGCCAANLHMGWPRLVQHTWLATRDEGLALALLVPSEVDTEIGGERVRIVCETRFPFGDDLTLEFSAARPVRLPLSVRVPGWASDVRVEFPDGTEQSFAGSALAGTFFRVERTFQPGDRLRLSWQATPRVSHWPGETIGIERGALVFALPIAEDWRAVGGPPDFADHEVHPAGAWAYALDTDDRHLPSAIEVELQSSVPPSPWSSARTPIALHVPAIPLPRWQAREGRCGDPPEPRRVAPQVPRESLRLVPFGCARLRIACFPWVRG